MSLNFFAVKSLIDLYKSHSRVSTIYTKTGRLYVRSGVDLDPSLIIVKALGMKANQSPAVVISTNPKIAELPPVKTISIDSMKESLVENIVSFYDDRMDKTYYLIGFYQE